MLGVAERITATGSADKRGRVRGLTDAQYMEMYASGCGCTKIARRAGVSAAQVRKDLRRLGVAIRPRKRVLALPPETYRQLYERDGLGLRAISKRHGLTEMKVWRDLCELGVALRSNVVQSGLRRDWFDLIDSDEKAYAFGLICADGSISKNRIRIQLQERDRPVLEALRHAAGGGHVAIVRAAGLILTGPGITSRCQATVGLRWDCAQMSKALQARGVCANKSQVRPVITAPDAFLGAFVRGLVDGDGCVYVADGKAPSISFVNLNESLLTVVAQYWESLTGRRPCISRRVRKDGREDKSVAVAGRAAVTVAKAMYLSNETTIALPRKRAAARRMVSSQEARIQ